MPFSPEAQRLIDQRARERMERINGTRPLFDTAYTKGDFRLAEPGAECWAWTADDVAEHGLDITQLRMTAYGEARGGVIIEITSDPDRETGELRRAFRCIDYTLSDKELWRAVVVLAEEQINPHSFEAPNWARIRNTYRRLCEQVGTKRQGHHEATARELEMVADAAKLAAIIARTIR